MKKRKIIILSTITTFVLILIFVVTYAYIKAPALINAYLQTTLQEYFTQNIQVQSHIKMKLSFPHLTAQIQNFILSDSKSSILSLKDLRLGVNIAHILKKKVKIQTIQLDNANLRLDLDQLKTEKQTPTKESQEILTKKIENWNKDLSGLKIKLSNINLNIYQGKQEKLHIKSLNLDSSLSQEISLNLQINDPAQAIKIKGKIKSKAPILDYDLHVNYQDQQINIKGQAEEKPSNWILSPSIHIPQLKLASDKRDEKLDFQIPSNISIAQGSLVIDSIPFPNMNLGPLKASFYIKDQKLSWTINNFSLFGIKTDHQGQLQTTTRGLEIENSTNISDLNLGNLTNKITGKAQAQITLQSQGNQSTSLKNNLKAKIKITAPELRIQGLDLDALILDVKNTSLAFAAKIIGLPSLNLTKSDGQTNFKDVHATINLQGSSLQIQAQGQSQQTQHDLSGQSSYIQQNLDLELKSHIILKSGEKILLPIHISGTWEKPHYGLDTQSLIKYFYSNPTLIQNLLNSKNLPEHLKKNLSKLPLSKEGIKSQIQEKIQNKAQDLIQKNLGDKTKEVLNINEGQAINQALQSLGL